MYYLRVVEVDAVNVAVGLDAVFVLNVGVGLKGCC